MPARELEARRSGEQCELGLKRTTLFYKMKRLGITPLRTHLQTELKIRSAPRSLTRLRSFMWAKAQSLSKMKCIVSAR